MNEKIAKAVRIAVVEFLDPMGQNNADLEKCILDVLKSFEPSKLDKEIERASLYLCEVELTYAEQIELIRNHEKQSDLIDYIDGVQVHERSEYSFSCKDFLEEIDC